MSIANCTRCDRVFRKLFDRKICPDCIQAEEEAYRLVVDFLDQNPGADLGQIAEGADVEEAQILRFIREGRLTLLDKLGDGARVACRRCEIPIASGQYCAPCFEEVGNALRDSARGLGEADERSSSRIRHAETLEEKRAGDSSRRSDRR